METWILIITTLIGSGQPTAITSIPGYPSLDVCQAAKAAVETIVTETINFRHGASPARKSKE